MRLQSSHLHTQEHEHERPVFRQACDPDDNNCFNDSFSTAIPAYTLSWVSLRYTTQAFFGPGGDVLALALILPFRILVRPEKTRLNA
jgi:hypothetical protein